jgi:hypothetical protein
LSRRGITGRPQDFERLIEELMTVASETAAGPRVIASDFVATDGYRAELILEPDGFDPAKADPMISDERQV